MASKIFFAALLALTLIACSPVGVDSCNPMFAKMTPCESIAASTER